MAAPAQVLSRPAAGDLHMRALVKAAPPDAPAMVLVPGLGMSGQYLLPLARRLAPSLRVYVPDLPGYGRSPGPPLGIEGLAASVVRLLERISSSPVVLHGHSLGALVVVEAAARAGERVAAVVLDSPAPDPAARSLAVQLGRLGREALLTPARLLAIAAADYARAGPRRLLATARSGLAYPIEETLARVAAPALVVRGDGGDLVPERWAAEAAALLPRGRLLVIPGAAHALPFTRPGALAEEVLGFLAGHADLGPSAARPSGDG